MLTVQNHEVHKKWCVSMSVLFKMDSDSILRFLFTSLVLYFLCHLDFLFLQIMSHQSSPFAKVGSLSDQECVIM